MTARRVDAMGNQKVDKESADSDQDGGHVMAATFAALGHPTRCAILHLLSAGDASAAALAEHFEVSRPAISQHLGVLVTSGLVRRHRNGRRASYSACTERVARLYEFLRIIETPGAFERNHHLAGRYRGPRQSSSEENDDNSEPLRVSYRMTPEGGLRITATYKL